MRYKILKRWEILNEALKHYQQYIKSKPSKFSLSIIDFIFISNFKGGNASITEPIETLPNKIKPYESILIKIKRKFGKKKLSSLNNIQLEELISICNSFLRLTQKTETKIRGFGPSNASALLFAYFPDLIPILDRRVLNGAGINVQLDSQGQVKNIASYYVKLIRTFYKELKQNKELTLRELDKKWFSKPI